MGPSPSGSRTKPTLFTSGEREILGALREGDFSKKKWVVSSLSGAKETRRPRDLRLRLRSASP